jgi:hypothetical protein
MKEREKKTNSIIKLANEYFIILFFYSIETLFIWFSITK